MPILNSQHLSDSRSPSRFESPKESDPLALPIDCLEIIRYQYVVQPEAARYKRNHRSKENLASFPASSMASRQRPESFYPYHFPSFTDNNSPAHPELDPAIQSVIDAMYVDQTCSFEFEKATQKPLGPDEDRYRFLSVYPTAPHPNAPHPCPLKDVFNEVFTFIFVTRANADFE